MLYKVPCFEHTGSLTRSHDLQSIAVHPSLPSILKFLHAPGKDLTALKYWLVNTNPKIYMARKFGTNIKSCLSSPNIFTETNPASLQ